MLCPGKSYSKMYETEPRYNDQRYNGIPDITMSFKRTERKIFPDITILQHQYTDTTSNVLSFVLFCFPFTIHTTDFDNV